MIKYNLICKNCNNSFDSWFSSSGDYEKLNKKKYINCHNCKSTAIKKTLMSPNILTSNNNPELDLNNKKNQMIKKKINNYLSSQN